MSGNGRQGNGKFAPGNSGGPGRPKRPVEADYLRTLLDVCPPDAWQAICVRAVEDAKGGDAKSREWIAKYLVGDKPDLVELAAREVAGKDHEVDVRVARNAAAEKWEREQAAMTPFERMQAALNC